MKVSEIYASTKDRLKAAHIEEAENDARLLLEYFLGITRNDILMDNERELSDEDKERLEKALVRREAREPLQYITGTAPFMGLDFKVDNRVLIPRSDTEILVEEGLRNLSDGSRILDICTGSGCILISLLNYSNDCTGIGIDLSEDALTVAKENAENILKDKNAATFLQGDLFEALKGDESFEMVVSNPPYIPTDIVETLMPEVKDHEPRMALDGTETGLVFYEKIIPGAKKILTVGGRLLLEIGYDQGEAVEKLMKDAGFIETEVIKDYAGLDRVVAGVKSAFGD